MRGMHTPVPVLKFYAVLPVTGISVTTYNTGTGSRSGTGYIKLHWLLLHPPTPHTMIFLGPRAVELASRIRASSVCHCQSYRNHRTGRL